ncbi:leucine-rich repeat and IQ domain-containing protein 1 isoform X1 [Pantherophis guttatus]|uniref:Leucine-rich repeat and IQ domain-containing protein 1 n=1 Tax=Pantherophis guttatus TaxID=94885 RepID=A0A6P9AKA4_PANGU|nr:leucine-rich repeat and IQ domain-containing protein 1 isoform X1 [Pantherophis guttatus]XP_060550621.1 leucine-rich repeat and IQ domain-containing protein 1 isoform X1 [Pantherophis guttatus]
MEEVYDDVGIEEEIELELRKTNYSSSEADDCDTDLSAESSSDSETIPEELPESVLQYLDFVRSRSQNAEKLLLQDLENVELSSDVYYIVPNNASEYLAELASQYNEDPEELKKRVLSEIEDEEQMSELSENTIELKTNQDISSNNIADGYSLTDANDIPINFSFQEVEERCKQEYQYWLEQQKVLLKEKMNQLKAKKDIEISQNEEEKQRRQLRQEELENERLNLEMFNAKQQTVMEEELLKEEQIWKEQLKEHEEFIMKLHTQIEEEKKAFEEQKAKERQQLSEQQNNAAIKIQTTFRAFMVYKRFGPVLKKKKEEREKEREMKEIMEKEMKEKEERWKRWALEKMQEKKEEKKRREEKEKKENEEKMRRHEEYEKKKDIVRFQRELIIGELKNEEKNKLEFLTAKSTESQDITEDTEQTKKQQVVEKEVENTNEKIQKGDELENAANQIESEEEGKTFENIKVKKERRAAIILEPSSINKALDITNKEKETKKLKEQEDNSDPKKLIMEKKHLKQASDQKYKEQNEQETHEQKNDKLWNDIGRSKDEELKSGREEHIEINNEESLENNVKNSLETAECQQDSNTNALSFETSAIVNQESIIHYLHVQLDSGDTGKVARSSASENSKIDFAPKEIHEEVNNQWAKGENSNNFFEQPLVSDSVETKRLAWMKMYKSWSRVYQEHQTKKIVERSKPWKCSSDQMPPLSATIIIQAGPWSSLQQVTTVNFQDLPGCSLSTLSQCARLQFLSLRRCGLLALEGLSDCKDLKYIDVEENKIQVINCENLENLCILILNKNNISSLHGLYGCSNLLNLELSYNKITRIGGLETLKKLQRLAVDHNQLISTKGLSATPTLLYLDCSFNHLTHIEGIEDCGLLQILKLQGNNLNEFPKLENHVLLRELYLEDNNISRLGKFTDYWLPLLQILFISQNSLTQLVSLCSYVSLEKLNISNNCLLDLKTLIQCLNGCDSLRELSLLGNPLLQEDSWRCSLLKNLPTLKILNDETVNCGAEKVYEKTSKSETFAAFCQAQIQEMVSLHKKATTRVDKFSEDSVQLQCWYFKKLMKLSIEHRYAHEYGVLNITKTEEPKNQADRLTQDFIEKNSFFTSGVKENKQDLLNMPERWITSGHTHAELINSFMTVPETDENQVYIQKNTQYTTNDSEESNALISPKRNKFNRQITTIERGNYLQHFDNSQNSAAIIIQSCWRGYRVRKEINFYTRLHLAATVIQSAWRSYCLRRKIVSCGKNNNHFLDRHKAATILQALWKGFRLRKKLASALAAVKTDEVEDDYKEINVDEFVFNEAVIEKEWPALDSNCFLSQTVLCSDQLPSPKCNKSTGSEDSSFHLKSPPHKMWQFRKMTTLSENSDVSNRSGRNTASQLSEAKSSEKLSLRFEKEEKISEEWGFKDISTAQLMLKRAHKMKAKKYNAKKVDPAVRLALFKNNENKHPPMKPPKKPQTTKIGYFEGKGEEFSHLDFATERIQRSKERTCQWLYTQVWDYEEASPRTEKCKHFLPEIDPEVLKGGRVQLVTSPVRREDTDLELVSLTSGSTLTQNREKNNQPHRHSAESSKKDIPSPEKSQLSPAHKERISFRDHPVQLSAGWGSGKKKTKLLK